MLKVKTIPVLSRMIAKLDVRPILTKLKEADIFKSAGNKKEALAEIKGEKAVELGFELIAEIMPQLDRIGDDIPEFISLYKGVSLEEAGEMDFTEILNEVVHDEGIRNFFDTALRRKVEQGS